MKTLEIFRTGAFTVVLLPSLATAHPGHLETGLAHLHAWDYLVALAVIGILGTALRLGRRQNRR